MTKDFRIILRIEDKTHSDLLNLAAKYDRTISWIVRTAIKRFIQSSKRKDFRL
jgi:predicted transcriptional regulator